MEEDNPFEIKNKEVLSTLRKFTQKPFTKFSKSFLKASQKGQLKSIYRSKDTQPEKVEAYKDLLLSRDIVIHESLLSTQEKNRLKELGISLDDYK